MFKLREDEKILLITQRHPITISLKIFPFAMISFVILISTAFLPFISSFDSEWMGVILEYTGEFNPLLYVLFLSFLTIFLFWQIIFIIATSYFFDCWIITNKRTVHTELHSLFRRYISSVNHNRIQDISVDVGGILPTYLNYGNLQVQTAGKFREFVFRNIPEPYEAKRVLMQAQGEIENSKRSNKKAI